MFSADLGVTPSSSTLYAEDVFSTFLYAGNGASLTINNGIDLAGKGGMVWIKRRDGANNAQISNTVQGLDWTTEPSNTQAAANQGILFTASSSGFSFNTAQLAFNNSGSSYLSWTFQEAPKFFDVVTYTGNGTGTSRLLNHNLGVTPGLYFIKSTSTTGDWLVGAPGLGTNPWGNLNTTFNWGNNTSFWLASSATTFGPGNTGGSNILNVNGQTYVAYLFADDPSTTGLIRCGSFTTDASGNASVTSLGWEPQFLMVKATSTTGDWIMLDSLRGWNMTTADALLRANLSNAETTTTEYGNPTATGFDFKNGSASATYVYMGIRRPNKPPTSGEQVFNLTTQDANSGAPLGGSLTTSAPHNVDMAFMGYRGSSSKNGSFYDRVRGFRSSSGTSPYLITSSTSAETTTGAVVFQTGVVNGFVHYVTSSTETLGRVSYVFKRAPGFFDVVCYTGDGTNQMRAHNLGVTPELIIVKGRNLGYGWAVYYGTVNSTLFLDLPDVPSGMSNVFYQAPTSTQFPAGLAYVTGQAFNYVAYLFASLPGISKIGTYTGNGTTQTINCGFAAGARFVLIKRIDAAGDWYVWDTARGIVAANDPHLSLNSTAAEVTTDDSVDPVSSGFAVNEDAATNINVSSAGYLYLAIA